MYTYDKLLKRLCTDLVAEEDLLEEPHDGALPRRQLRRAHVPEGEVPRDVIGGEGGV